MPSFFHLRVWCHCWWVSTVRGEWEWAQIGRGAGGGRGEISVGGGSFKKKKSELKRSGALGHNLTLCIRHRVAALRCQYSQITHCSPGTVDLYMCAHSPQYHSRPRFTLLP